VGRAIYDHAARARHKPHEFDLDWLREHLAEERRRTEILGEIREAIFGAQDGLVSTLTVVTAVGAATGERFPVLVAGLAAALAGVFSMGIGEYMSSKSQREIYDAEISDEREEVEQRPAEAEAEVAYMLQQEGLTRDLALRAAADLATSKAVLLKTMVEKEHGIVVEPGAGPRQGALIMGISFGIGSIFPVLPYVFLPVPVALWAAMGITAAALFAIGATKSRWTRRNPFVSGLEIVALAAVAAGAGYLFGLILPSLLGVEPPI
jgi:predicted membrane protein (TIGR00267 family)